MNLENLRKFEEIQVTQKYIAPLIIVLSGFLSLFTVINEIMITDSPLLSMVILFCIYNVSISIPYLLCNLCIDTCKCNSPWPDITVWCSSEST